MLRLSDNARAILEKRYLRKEGNEVIETPEEMFRRVARAVAEGEKTWADDARIIDQVSDRFYVMMTEMNFLPNSPTLMNAGRELGQLSACFVLPVEDSMEAIFTAVKDAALIHKSGGGTGFAFSRLRPKNSPVRTTGGVASGPVSFMKVFNAATDAIKQGGTRRGANMGILRIDHPDIKEFITCKKKDQSLTNFNISVGITEEFMLALESDDYYELGFAGQIYDRLKAREVFDLIIDQAWSNGEPGLIFLDCLNRANPTPALGNIEATNPCGEQPLLPYEACNLGSLNLSHVVRNKGIDWDRLSELVYWSVRFLDDVIEVSQFPLPVITEMVKGNRKIGLGIMGWAELLFRLGLAYDSEEAVSLARKVMSFIQDKGHDASRELARIRGSFPNIEQSIYHGQDMRNATITTIAPTGTISMIAGTTSGIEPVFALAYTKNVLDGQELLEVNPVFADYVRTNFSREKSDEIFQLVAETGQASNLQELPEEHRRVFVTALEISPEWHIKHQGAFQRYCDNAVSKTVNFPAKATKEDVSRVYLLAYELGCKGVTVYREGSREEEVLSRGKKEQAATKVQVDDKDLKIKPRSRPKRTIGVTEAVKTGCGKMYITVNFDREGLIETFITTGSTGGCQGFTEGVSRLISLALRANIEPESIIDQLTSVSCPNFLRRKATDKRLVGKSCPDIIGRVLAQGLKEQKISWPELAEGNLNTTKLAHFIEACASCENCLDEGNRSQTTVLEASDYDLAPGPNCCPDCGEPLRYSEGCQVCRCGYSKCS